MSESEKVKMCPFCEGDVPVQASLCKYCGSSLAKEDAKSSFYATEQDSLSSLYEPPYSAAKKRQDTEQAVDKDYYDAPEFSSEDSEEYTPVEKKPKKSKKAKAKKKKESLQVGALLLMSLGGHLFTLGWILCFFSDHGRVVLEWNSHYWFLYLVFSCPFFYQGWKRLEESTEDSC